MDAGVTAPEAYFVPEDNALRPTVDARSPWSADMLHGRLLAGLAARAAEREVDAELRLARLTVDMFKAAPMTPIVTTSAVVRAGARLRVVDVTMACDSVEVGRARALFLRPGGHPQTDAWQAPRWDAPPPEDVAPTTAEAPGGWELRVMTEGGFWSGARKRVWSIDRWALVAGERLSPAVRAALAADLPNPLANSGPHGLAFINADLTLFLARPPRSEWIGLEVADHLGVDGIAVGTCTMYDTDGPIGLSTVCAVRNAPLDVPE